MRSLKGGTTKTIIRRVTYFTLSQLRRWRTDQTRRWLLAETGGKLPLAVGTQIVFPRNKPDGLPFVAGEWLCNLTAEKAIEAGVPEKNAEPLVRSIRNFETKCAAVSIQRWSRKMLGKLEIRRLQKMDKHRMNVAKELLATEETYVEQLNIMCELLYRPLTKDKKFQHVLSQEEVRTIFSDIEVIAAVNTSLRDTLKGRIESWTNWTKIGDLFIHMSDYLRVYVDYVKGYSRALELVSGMNESHPFRKFFRDQIKSAPPVYANFNFESLLIVPIQRIPRYKMLLTDMHKNMRPEHPDYQGLEDALKKVGEIADWVNENQKNAERMAKSVLLSERVIGMDEQLISASRQFIMEGLVMEAQVQNPQPRTLLLFSDILVVCDNKMKEGGSLLKKRKDKLQFREKYRLYQTHVEEAPPVAGFEHCFRVWKTGDEMGGVVYSALNDDARKDWVEAMDKAITEATKNQKKKEEELNKVATSKAQQAAAILSQQYASIRYAGQPYARHHTRGESSTSSVGLVSAGNVAGGAAATIEGSESASDVAGRTAHSRLSSMSSSTNRKQVTWFSMNAAEKWRIVEEAKAELENLRNMSAIEEALQKQRAKEAQERNKALIHSKYSSIGVSYDGPVAQRFNFGQRRSVSGATPSADGEKRRSMLVSSDSGSPSGSNGDEEEDVVFDDASSQYSPLTSTTGSSSQPPIVVVARVPGSTPAATPDSSSESLLEATQGVSTEATPNESSEASSEESSEAAAAAAATTETAPEATPAGEAKPEETPAGEAKPEETPVAEATPEETPAAEASSDE